MSTISNIPRHVAIIMDGNGRWAVGRGMQRIEGHAGGVESVRASLRAAVRGGVEYLTLYAFSTENWGRPREEVDGLMELFCQCVEQETAELLAQGVRVRMIGARGDLPPKVAASIERIESDTAAGNKLTLLLALSYSSRSEIVRAVQHLAREAAAKIIEPEEITEETITASLDTRALPDPDLLVRTGGEQRLSNFLLWQSAYTELYFTQTMWPDFREEDFDAALAWYAGRQRRFGLVKNNEQ